MPPRGAPLERLLRERGDLGAALVELRAAVTGAIVQPCREDGVAVLELEVQVAVGVGGVEQLCWDRWDLYPRAVVPRHDEAARQPGDERVDHPSDAALKHIGERDRVPVRPQARYAYSGAALVALMLLLADQDRKSVV